MFYFCKLQKEHILNLAIGGAQPNISHFGGVKPFQNGNTTIYDPFNPFIGDRINGIGRGVNDNIVPEKDEILNNINFNRKLSGKQIKNKDKSPFKKNPNVKSRIVLDGFDYFSPISLAAWVTSPDSGAGWSMKEHVVPLVVLLVEIVLLLLLCLFLTHLLV